MARQLRDAGSHSDWGAERRANDVILNASQQCEKKKRSRSNIMLWSPWIVRALSQNETSLFCSWLLVVFTRFTPDSNLFRHSVTKWKTGLFLRISPLATTITLTVLWNSVSCCCCHYLDYLMWCCVRLHLLRSAHHRGNTQAFLQVWKVTKQYWFFGKLLLLCTDTPHQ